MHNVSKMGADNLGCDAHARYTRLRTEAAAGDGPDYRRQHAHYSERFPSFPARQSGHLADRPPSVHKTQILSRASTHKTDTYEDGSTALRPP